MKNRYRISKYRQHTKELFCIEKFVPERKASFWRKKREEHWVRCILHEDAQEGTIDLFGARRECTTFNTLEYAKEKLEAVMIEESNVVFVEVVYEAE